MMLGSLSLLVALASSLAATLPAEPSPRVTEPARLGKLSEQDRTAREHLLIAVNGKQEDEFRRRYAVVVPELPTGLPDDYDILVYGQAAGILLLRIEIKVRGRLASAEMVTVDGIRRGELPAAECDDLARQTAYAFQAEQKPRNPQGWDLPGYSAIGSPARWQRLELVSCDRRRRFHLRTAAWQTLADTVSVSTAGAPGFAHAQTSEALERMAREQLRLVERSDELGREINQTRRNR